MHALNAYADVVAVLCRQAMTRDTLPVRTWERSSSRVTGDERGVKQLLGEAEAAAGRPPVADRLVLPSSVASSPLASGTRRKPGVFGGGEQHGQPETAFEEHQAAELPECAWARHRTPQGSGVPPVALRISAVM